MAKNPLHELKDLGQVIWLDSIRRHQIVSGELRRLIDEDGLTGETANPSIFEKAIVGSTDYDQAIQRLGDDKTPLEIYETLAIEDVQMAADVFRPIYEETQGADGFVSIEVSPKLAHDTQGSIDQAQLFFKRANRPNIMIKIPGTKEGVPAIEECLYRGVNINITLLFSIAAYEQVARAYIRALERRAAEGKPIDRLASVASFFVSRIDTLADKLLSEKLKTAAEPALSSKLQALQGRIAIANARIAYQKLKAIFADPRFLALQAKGGRVQRPLWASTSTKNPHYSDILYVESLVGPHTINTLPLETINAYRDHGRPQLALEQDLDEARRTLDDLAAVGLSLDAITQQVLDEGIARFDADLDKLLESIVHKRQAGSAAVINRQAAALGRYQPSIQGALTRAEQEKIADRIWKKDASLWKSDPNHQNLIRTRLGWLTAMTQMEEHVGDLHAFGDDIRHAGFNQAVLCGMGGSSLCVEVLRATFGSARGHPQLYVLDSTDPSTIKELEKKLDVAHTLFIISSKSGETVETLDHYKYFHDLVRQRNGERTGENFVAITDPGSGLEEVAKQDLFRRIFKNPSDIGGRYSALSYFGLVPAAVMGIDVDKLVDRAQAMAHACASCVRSEENPGVWLGVTLATLAKQGRDKITFVVSPGIDTFGMWAEQLIAESTGKEGKGLVPVDGEPLGAPAAYGDDRVFIYLRLAQDKNGALERQLSALEQAGHPVLRLDLDDPFDLGAEFFRWEFAIATAGSLMGIDAFDQPNVQESKDNTQRVLTQPPGGLKPSWEDRHLALYSTVPSDGTHSLEEALGAFLRQARSGDYLAFMAYVQQNPENHAALEDARLAVRDALKIATTLGYGPRFLHSTGQLHKGGPNSLLALQITAVESIDAEIPGEKYTFGELKAAQAIGDWQSLVSHGRRALHIHLKQGAKLSSLKEAIVSALGVGAPADRAAHAAVRATAPKPARAVGKQRAAGGGNGRGRRRPVSSPTRLQPARAKK